MSLGVTLIKRACIDIGKCRQLEFLMLNMHDQPLAEVDDQHPETASKTGKIRGVQQGTSNITHIIIYYRVTKVLFPAQMMIPLVNANSTRQCKL